MGTGPLALASEHLPIVVGHAFLIRLKVQAGPSKRSTLPIDTQTMASPVSDSRVDHARLDGKYCS